jgi:hypothetical protein
MAGLNLEPARKRVERLLVDQVRLMRDRPDIYDDMLNEETGELVPSVADRSTLWTGPAAVLADREDGTFRVLVPMGAPLLEVGDFVEVVASQRDPHMVHRIVRVRRDPRGGTFGVIRVLHCIAPDRWAEWRD